jgi:enoyl-CoA hydratase
MEFILTGDSATGVEFNRLGIVRAFPKEQVLGQALALAGRIASLSGPIVTAAKQAVLTADSSTLEMGMTHEKALYYATFDVQDCQEGLKAFIEKRDPVFKHE